MADLESPRFPDAISKGSQLGPAYSTGVGRNFGGKTARNRNWSSPLYEGDVIFGVKTQSQLNDLLAFFHHVAGRFGAFRVKNWNDYTVTGSEGIVTTITTNTTFQMWKRATWGGAAGNHKLQKIVSGTTIVSGGGSYTVDENTGIITRNSGANPTGFTCEFDLRMVFDTDKMLPTWLDFALYSWGPIRVVEDPL